MFLYFFKTTKKVIFVSLFIFVSLYNFSQEKINSIKFSQTEIDTTIVAVIFLRDTMPPIKKRIYKINSSDSVIEFNKQFFRKDKTISVDESIYINLLNEKITTNSEYNQFNKENLFNAFPEGEINKDSLSISVIKDVTKKIKGIQCYKVIIDRFGKKSESVINYTYEIYATNKIRETYHPIFGKKEFLKEFYPLYIKRTGEFKILKDSVPEQLLFLKKIFDMKFSKEKIYKLDGVKFKKS